MAQITVDVAGGAGGGAGRFRTELYDYLARSGRRDVQVIGGGRRLDPPWLLRRELASRGRARQVALNNVGFIRPGGERWTLLANALHFLTEPELARLHPSLRPVATRQGPVVRLAARRSDVLVAPCTAMAERVTAIMPGAAGRIVVRMHPVSPRLPRPELAAAPALADGPGAAGGPGPAGGPGAGTPPGEAAVLCPVIFEAYKHMPRRLAEWAAAADLRPGGPPARLLVTAAPGEVPAELAAHPAIELVGRLSETRLQHLWERSQAVFFPPGLESFGFPLAEARANGQPVIARDTAQNREIAGPALCGYTAGQPDSLRAALDRALAIDLAPDPQPFDPDEYFAWMLGPDA